MATAFLRTCLSLRGTYATSFTTFIIRSASTPRISAIQLKPSGFYRRLQVVFTEPFGIAANTPRAPSCSFPQINYPCAPAWYFTNVLKPAKDSTSGCIDHHPGKFLRNPTQLLPQNDRKRRTHQNQTAPLTRDIRTTSGQLIHERRATVLYGNDDDYTYHFRYQVSEKKVKATLPEALRAVTYRRQAGCACFGSRRPRRRAQLTGFGVVGGRR